jgi:hypothetical protein
VPQGLFKPNGLGPPQRRKACKGLKACLSQTVRPRAACKDHDFLGIPQATFSISFLYSIPFENHEKIDFGDAAPLPGNPGDQFTYRVDFGAWFCLSQTGQDYAGLRV